MKKLFSLNTLILLLLWVLLAGYARVLLNYFVPVTGGTDQNGYHVGSWMILDQGRFFQRAEDDFSFVGHMWVVNERGEYYPKYPPLYPLLAAGAIRLSGQMDAGFWLSPLCAVLTIAGVFALFRVFFSKGWALLGALAMSGTPVFLFYGLNKASHAPSMAFVTWGMAFFFLACCKRNMKKALVPAWLGGFLIGYAVGIRYTNFLLLFPPLIYALCFLRGRRWWLVLDYLAGAAVPGLFLAVFHQLAFGAPWRTGYALTAEQSGFSPDFLLTNLRLYTTGLLDHGTGPLTLFSMMGLVLLIFRRPRRALVFLVWILPLFLLYNCYYWAPTTSYAGYLRFVMPILVPLYLLALYGLRVLMRPLTRATRICCMVAVLAVQSMWGIYQGLIQAEKRWAQDRISLESLNFVRREVPEGSVIFSETGLLNQLDFGKHWHLYSTQIFEPQQIKRMLTRNEQADVTPLQPERLEKWRELLVDVSSKDYQQQVRDLIQGHLDAGRAVYILGPERRVANLRNRFRRQLVMENRALLEGEMPAYLWISPAKQSMRNLEIAQERSLPKLRLLEVTAVQEQVANREQFREDLQSERSQLEQELYHRYPELRPQVERLKNLERQILRSQPTRQ